uniref:Uncharacterized protein n=1 Tax=Parascaris equorum TaxID=6256 RepID=A0A914RTB1_PAREQ
GFSFICDFLNNKIYGRFYISITSSHLSFILQAHRITLRFCKQSESSVGMRNFIENDIKRFAQQNPSIVIYVTPIRFAFRYMRVEQNIADLPQKKFSTHRSNQQTATEYISSLVNKN